CRELHLRKSLNQTLNCDLSFQARELRSDAEVNTCAERQVLVIAPAKIQFIRLIELPRVAVGCSQHAENCPTLGNTLTTNLDVFLQYTSCKLHRALETKELFYGRANHFGLASEFRHLFWITQ